MARDRVLVDLTIAAPLAEVWSALRDPAQLVNWFGWDYPGLAEETDFIFIKSTTPNADKTVLQFGEWEGTSDRIELEPISGGTRVRVVRSGGSDEDGWENIYNEMVVGWSMFIAQLRLLLEGNTGRTRQNFYLSGNGVAGQALPREALGLAGAASGETSALASPTGEVPAVLAFHAPFQTSVSAYGNGLVVVTDKPEPKGGSISVTAFGMPDADFAALKQQWTDWWTERYPAA